MAMPLFECSECHCVENTALCDYWIAAAQKTDPLCSGCDPAIGKWHEAFPKRLAADADYQTGKDGFLFLPKATP